MPLSEFDIIARYFAQATPGRDDVVLGIGDDAAVIDPPAGQQLAVVIDTLVAGVHFPLETDPYDIGWKALAVNLSDLAAMGAEPAWLTLALTLEQSDEQWLAGFSRGLSELAGQYGLQLVGGDTTRGSLTVTVQVAGYLPPGQALTRQGAAPGEEIWVSGTLGDAALGLRLVQGGLEAGDSAAEQLCGRLNRPQPRLSLGIALRGMASSCIDISDGLLADLGHVCAAADCGAALQYADLPLSSAARDLIAADSGLGDLPLIGGDDYELCFTAPADRHTDIQVLAGQLDCPLTRIGRIEVEPGIRCLEQDGSPRSVTGQGYRHFNESS
ncbi:thiamine-phosphate kinase [Thiohalophilus thiocyanatoxydans]|uniref:Thiamine-monophosphate kinase n=1 Tax=Thiohalophilus thiocyanatoxydans TaxID=381308 RepID=A0A4R8ILM4_9GAMM|nr:thiamine-phosphate kinase [Thiohalophilus thiocyanatoxydans]TDY01696.1 thiamine-phosphate kinase [Thiohalophilus thiocyanatoxydans]